MEVLRNRERLTGGESHPSILEGQDDLQGEERVSPRNLVELSHSRTGNRHPGTLLDERVDCPHAQRREQQRTHPVLRKAVIQPEWGTSSPFAPHGQQEPDGHVPEPSQHEGERIG